MQINVVTLFPEVVAPYLGASIPGRAAAAGRVRYRLLQLRDFAHDRHHTVDDSPYGGGAGMVLKPGPVFEAVASLDEESRAGPIVLLSARGRRFSHRDAVRLSLGPTLTLLCGHYKDVDQRVADGLATDELSLGDFVLSGGELAATCVIDAVVRLLPGVLGDHESAELHQAAGVRGSIGPGGPALRQPCGDRGLAAGGGRAAHRRTPAGSVGGVSGETPVRGVAGALV
jgi:tRNA (guanine37-N1)-methyltransferase